MKKWQESIVLELGTEKTEKNRPQGCYCEDTGNKHSHGAQWKKCNCCNGLVTLPSFPDSEGLLS